MSLELIAVLLLILAAEFVNGWTDAPNAIATVVGTRSLSPRLALALASVFNLIGVLSGTVVAATIGKDIIEAIYWLFRQATPGKVRSFFRWLQIASSAFMAFSHGSNDGQKFMGAFTLALVLAGVLPPFVIPLWVVGLCALVMAAGTSIGGWRIMRTLGMRLTNLKTHQGFAAETAAAGTITVASALGIPLSMTHTISTSIMGVGAVRGVRAVHWGTTKELVTAWVLTFPICAAISRGVVKLMLFMMEKGAGSSPRHRLPESPAMPRQCSNEVIHTAQRHGETGAIADRLLPTQCLDTQRSPCAVPALYWLRN